MSCFPALPVLLASLTLHEFWSTLGHFEKHPTSAKGNPLTNRSKGGIRIPFMKPQKPIPSKETRETQQTLSSLKEYHSSPQQQAARSQVPNLLWHSPRVCHQSTPSDWHRLSFPQKDGRIFWGNRPVFFQRPAFTTASQIFNSLTLANVMRIHNLCPQIELNCFCRRKESTNTRCESQAQKQKGQCVASRRKDSLPSWLHTASGVKGDHVAGTPYPTPSLPFSTLDWNNSASHFSNSNKKTTIQNQNSLGIGLLEIFTTSPLPCAVNGNLVPRAKCDRQFYSSQGRRWAQRPEGGKPLK